MPSEPMTIQAVLYKGEVIGLFMTRELAAASLELTFSKTKRYARRDQYTIEPRYVYDTVEHL